MNWSIVSAVNNDRVANACLLSSPDLSLASEIYLQRGYLSAASAYNAAIDAAETDILIFTHQDMYFPPGWISAVQKALAFLENIDNHWGILGVWGGTTAGKLPGYMYWTGLQHVAGRPFDGALEVETLDEVVLILRKSSGLRFDEQLSGYHMYGTDICLEAKSRGMKCYVISAFCIHNTAGYRMLPLQFWRNYLHVRKKWKAYLPISSPCVDISNWCWPLLRWNVVQAVNILAGRYTAVTPVADPSKLYEDLVGMNLISASRENQFLRA